jgi:ABC-type sugar transport system substrate-binding protein
MKANRIKIIGLVVLALAFSLAVGMPAGASSRSSKKIEPRVGTISQAAAYAESAAAANMSSKVLVNWNKGGKVIVPLPSRARVHGKKIGYLGFGQNNPWSQWMFKAVQAEAAKFGATATFIGPPSFDPQVEYQEIVSAAETKQYAGLVVVPIDGPSLVRAEALAVKAGIKVVNAGFSVGAPLSTVSPVRGVVSQVIENLKTDSQALAQGVIHSCVKVSNCQVDVLWGDRALSWDAVKPKFFYALISKHHNIHLVCQTDADYTETEGTTEVAACLLAHPGMSVIASSSDYTSLGAVQAIEHAHRNFGLASNDIKIVSSYSAVYGIKMVRDGLFEQTWYNRPQAMGAAATALALDAMEGIKVPAYINQSNLDNIPTTITPAVAKKFPGLLGQWSF